MTSAVDTVERLLCERYNVASLDGLGPLPGAIESARQGDIAPLHEALEDRELYRWHAPIAEALRAVHGEKAVAPEPKPQHQPEAVEVAPEPEADEAPDEPADIVDVPAPIIRRVRRGA